MSPGQRRYSLLWDFMGLYNDHISDGPGTRELFLNDTHYHSFPGNFANPEREKYTPIVTKVKFVTNQWDGDSGKIK